MIDIYHSRRGHFWKCTYWVRDLSNKHDWNEWVLKEEPSGIFFAKQDGQLTKNKSDVMNVMLVDSHNVNIVTNDHIDDLIKGSLVKFNDLIWLVDSITQQVHLKESQFGKGHYTSYIALRR